MLKTICQIIFFCCMPMLSGKESTGWEFSTYIMDCMELENFERQLYSYYIDDTYIADTESLMETQKELETLPNKSVGIRIGNADLDTGFLIEELADCWKQYRKRNGYALSVTYNGLEENQKNTMTPFLSLLEEECLTGLEEELKKKGGFPAYIRMERIDGLDVYSFYVTTPGPNRSEKDYIVVFINGIWEKQKVCWQHVTLPAIGPNSNSLFQRYFIARMDINYDGCADLLIHEGSSSGSGGSWNHYKGIIWKADLGEFVWYESFPESVSSTEFLEKRMIKNYSLGVSEEHVIEYKVVDGEWCEIRELAWIDDTLFYYEMGILVREHDTQHMGIEKICEQYYPDLNYWRKG